MSTVQPKGDRRRRTRRIGPALRAVAIASALGIALAATASGCGDGGSDADEVPTTLAARPTLPDVAAAIGCIETAPLDGLLAPIRGGAATDGLACDLPGATGVHLFERAPLGPEDATGWDLGGRIENIDRLVETRAEDASSQAECPALVLVGTGYFVVGDDAGQVERVGEIVGHVERPAVSAAPLTSYLSPPCKADVSTADGSG